MDLRRLVVQAGAAAGDLSLLRAQHDVHEVDFVRDRVDNGFPQDGVFVAPDDLDSNPAARLMVYAVAPGRDPAMILAGLRERMEAVFLPRRVLLVPSLPRNAIGKLTRQALEDLRRQPVAGGQ